MSLLFDLNDTQAMLCDSLARYLADHWSDEIRARTLAATSTTTPTEPPPWRGLARRLGLLGAGFDEASVGLGGGLVDHLVILETLGGSLAAEPYLSTVVIGGGVFRRDTGAMARGMLARILAAEAVVAFAGSEPLSRHDPADVRTRLVADGGGYRLEGRKAVVTNAPWATELLVSARSRGAAGDAQGLSLVCIPADAPGLRRSDYRTVDGCVASEIEFDGVPVQAGQLIGPPGDAGALLAQVMDEATLAVCAEAVGVMRRLLRDTLDHVRERRQFGVPIASFQALQHRLADMHLALEQAAALTAATAEQMNGPAAAMREAAVSSAKVMISRACRVVGQGAVQLHGGMGMTEELALGHYFRRATRIEQMFGSVNWHLRRVEQLAQR